MCTAFTRRKDLILGVKDPAEARWRHTEWNAPAVQVGQSIKGIDVVRIMDESCNTTGLHQSASRLTMGLNLSARI
jgi:hypothetical protein